MKLVYDLSSVLWTSLLAGKDKEGYEVLDAESGKKVHINTAAYGYENAVNYINSAIRESDSAPINAVFVVEGMNSKARRLMMDPYYKSKRGKRAPDAYKEFNQAKELLKAAYRSVGSLFVQQNNVEADDVIAWFAENTEEDITIVSNDNDLVKLIGVNKHGAQVNCRINGVYNTNPYGVWDASLITAYKALVGDTSDSIKGITGFGDGAFEKFYAAFKDAGLQEMYRLGMLGTLDELGIEADSHPLIKKIYDGRDEYLKSFALARMYPEWVNNLSDPIEWSPGMVVSTTRDERLRQWSAQVRLVTAGNYDAALQFLKTKIAESPFFSVDLETTVPGESDDWLAERNKEGKGVDVISSRITGCSISFGKNTQYAYYVSVEHADTDNCTLGQLASLLELLPADAIKPAHNAAGFELPVLYNAVGATWLHNGWRGFMPNLVDTRIAASYWDENQPTHALKPLAKLLLDYTQTTYEEVTQGRKMHQLTGEEVLHYGCDDVYTSGALWVFFKWFMQTEHTFKPFMEIEQKPMYLQALGYVQGVPLDLPRMSKLAKADREAQVEHSAKMDTFLVSKGWDGTVCPQFTEIDNKAVKACCEIVLGQKLETMVRTVSKMIPMVEELEGGKMLAELLKANDVVSINQLLRMKFVAKPTLNTGSPKQLQNLLYETLGVPVRLRNKPTETMRKSGIKEGTPRTDEDAIKMAIKMGDVGGDDAALLKSLMELKSIATRTGLYWEAYPKMVHWQTGRLHAELRQSSTNTRRYTGASPNLQQMDSSPDGVRSCILPHHKNAVIASLDESAQEVRQLADYCLDPALLTCYLGSPDQLRDVHSIVACKIAGCTYEEFRRRLKKGSDEEQVVANGQRQTAKITLFATIYGAAAPKIAEGLGIATEEAQAYIDAIYEQFPGVKQWKEESEEYARTHGIVTIHGGTVRHLGPLITSEDTYTASKALRQAGNARIQSAGGNQIKRVMSRIWDSTIIEDYDYRWYFSVHDETVHSIHKDHVIQCGRVLHGFMTEQFLNTVPSASSVGIGKNYGQLIEIGESFDEVKLQAAIDKLFEQKEAANV